MHVLGILYLCLFLGALLSLGDAVGARRFDRMRAQSNEPEGASE